MGALGIGLPSGSAAKRSLPEHPLGPLDSRGSRSMPVPGLSIICHQAVQPFGLFRNAMGHFRHLLPELHMLTAYIQRRLQQ